MAARNASWMPASSAASLLRRRVSSKYRAPRCRNSSDAGEHGGDAPGSPGQLQRRGDRERSLQQVHGVARGGGRREHAERTRRQQLHLHAGEALAQRVDLVLVGLPFVMARVQQQPERRRARVPRPARSARRAPSRGVGDRSAGNTSGGASGGAQRDRVVFEQCDQLAGHGRQQRRCRVDSLRLQPGGAQLGEPAIDASRSTTTTGTRPVSARTFADARSAGSRFRRRRALRARRASTCASFAALLAGASLSVASSVARRAR